MVLRPIFEEVRYLEFENVKFSSTFCTKLGLIDVTQVHVQCLIDQNMLF